MICEGAGMSSKRPFLPVSTTTGLMDNRLGLIKERPSDQAIGALKVILSFSWLTLASLAGVIFLRDTSRWPVSSGVDGVLDSFSAAWMLLTAGVILLVRILIREVPRELWHAPRHQAWERLSNVRDAVNTPTAAVRGRIRTSEHAPPQRLKFDQKEFRSFLNDAIGAFESSFDEMAGTDLFRRLVYPDEQQLRIAEIYSIKNGVYRQRVSRTLILREGSTTVVSRLAFWNRTTSTMPTLVPVLRVAKGDTVDNLKIEASSGTADTLSYLESQGAIASLLISFAVGIFDNVGMGTKIPSDVAKRFRDCLYLALAPEQRGSVAAVAERRLVKAYRRALRAEVPNVQRRADAMGDVRALAWVIRHLAEYYFVIVACTSDRARVKVSAERDMPIRHGRRANGGRSGGILALAIGGPDNTHRLPIRHALEARSYHLYVRIPANTYIYRYQYVVKRGDTERILREVPLLPSTKVKPPSRLASAKSRTLDYLHIFVTNDSSAMLSKKNAPKSGIRAVRSADTLKLEIRERPPGFSTMLLFLGLYITFVAVAITLLHSQVLDIRANTGSDDSIAVWSVILVATPTLASAWITGRFWQGQEHRASLTLVWSAFMLVFLSVVTAFLGGVLLVEFMSGDTEASWTTDVWMALVFVVFAAFGFVVQRHFADMARFEMRKRAAERTEW